MKEDVLEKSIEFNAAMGQREAGFTHSKDAIADRINATTVMKSGRLTVGEMAYEAEYRIKQHPFVSFGVIFGIGLVMLSIDVAFGIGLGIGALIEFLLGCNRASKK
jgi:hypothetical protein